MSETPLHERDLTVRALAGALNRGGFALKLVPECVVRVIEEEGWRHRVVTQTGEEVQFETFEEFVGTDPLAGLGADMKLLRNLCRDHPAACEALDVVTQRPAHVHVDVNNIDVIERPRGTSKAAAFRALRKHRPDLHAQVLAGDLSPHGAMVKAGLRPKTVTVRASAEGFVRAIRRHLSDEDIATVIATLEAM